MNNIDAAVRAILTPLPNPEHTRSDKRRLQTKRLMSNVSATLVAAIDWDEVLKSATEELREVEKSLNTASYLVQALWRVGGPHAAARGLAALATLVGTTDQPLVPTKPRFQKRSLQYLLASLGDLLAAETVSSADRQAYEDLLSAVDDLRANARRRIGKEQPDFHAFRHSTTCALIRAVKLEQAHSREPALDYGALPERVNIRYAMSDFLDRKFRRRSVKRIHEDRLMEVALARELTVGVTRPLFVLIRLVTTDNLLHRLSRKAGNPGDAPDADSSDMHIDFTRSSSGEPLPVRCVVSVRSDDVTCEPPSAQVRIYFNRDAPLSVFNVTPLRCGATRLVVEARVEDDLVGAEHIWRQCIERSSSDAPIQCQYVAVTLTSMSRERRLVEFLSKLFSAAQLRRWIYLFAREWAPELPDDRVPDDEMAFKVVETGLRAGRVDKKFFAALARDFPPHAEALAELGGFFSMGTQDSPGHR